LNVAHWAERDNGLSAGQHAVLPKGKGIVIEYATCEYNDTQLANCLINSSALPANP